MDYGPLSILIERRIRDVVGDTNRMDSLEHRLSMTTSTATNIGAIFGDHNNKLSDAHGIQEIVLNVINSQALLNAGLEVDSDNDGVPDGWTSHVDDGLAASFDLDASRKQYGYRSLKIEFSNDSEEDKEAYISQVVTSNISPGRPHTISYYHHDQGVDFANLLRVIVRDGSDSVLDTFEFAPRRRDVGIDDDFTRAFETFDVHEDAESIEVQIGVTASPDPLDGTVWIDYPLLSGGVVAFRPPELVAGIVHTDHIYTKGLDARVISTGILRVGDNDGENGALTIESNSGFIKLSNELLEFYTGGSEYPTPFIRIGDDGTTFGMQILRDGVPTFLANDEGNLTLSGVITVEGGDVEGDLTVGDNIIIEGDTSRIKIVDEGIDQLIFGALIGGEYGLAAGGTKLTKDGILIQEGIIQLGDDGSGGYNFSVGNDGVLYANSAHIEGILTAGVGSIIGGFEIGADYLQSSDQDIILDSAEASITLSPDIHYSTIIQPEGIFGKVPLWQADNGNFDPFDYDQTEYYVASMSAEQGVTEFVEGVDYYWSPRGEVLRARGSDIPSEADDLKFTYTVYDSGVETEYVESSQSFVDAVRASALISDDGLLDLTHIKNLVIGAANIGRAVITSAHIDSLSADLITTGDLIISEGMTFKNHLANLILDDVSFRSLHPSTSEKIFEIDYVNGDVFVDGEIRMRSGYIVDSVTIGSEGPTVADISSDAENGSAAYDETANYRQTGPPANDPSTDTAPNVAMTKSGSVDITLTWDTYTQDANKKADFILLFWKKDDEDELGAPTANDSCVTFNVNTSSASYYTFEGLAPEKYYSFGIAAGRRTEEGLEIGSIVSPSNWQDVTSAEGDPIFQGDVTGTIDGKEASAIKTAVVSVETNEDIWQRAASFDSDGKLDTSYLLNEIDAAANNVLAGTNQTVRIDDNGIRIHAGLGGSYDPDKYIQLNSSGVILTENGGTDVITAITTKGILADAVIIGDAGPANDKTIYEIMSSWKFDDEFTAIHGGAIQTNTVKLNSLTARTVSDNLVVNSNFETGDFEGWEPPSGAEVVQVSDSQDGAYVARKAGVGLLRGDPFPINQLKEYYFEFWVRAEGTEDSKVFLGYEALDSDQDHIDGNGGVGGTFGYCAAANVTVVKDSGWKSFSARVKGYGASTTTNFPSGTKYVRPMLLLNYGGNANQTIEVASVKISEASQTEIDGGQLRTGNIIIDSEDALEGIIGPNWSLTASGLILPYDAVIKFGDDSEKTISTYVTEAETAAKDASEKRVHRGTSAPGDTTIMWLDTTPLASSAPAILKVYSSGAWVKATPTQADEIAETGSKFWAAEADADKTSGNTSADTAAVNGTSASIVKQGATVEKFNPHFEMGKLFWGNAATGATYNHLAVPGTIVSEAGVRGSNVLEATGPLAIFWGPPMAVDTSRIYKGVLRIKQEANPTSGGSLVYAGAACLDGSYTNITDGVPASYRYFITAATTIEEEDGWETFEAIITGEDEQMGNFPAGTKYVRPMLLANYASGDGTVHVDSLEFFDITEPAKIADGTYGAGTFISNKKIYSPEIVSPRIVATAGGDEAVVITPDGLAFVRDDDTVRYFSGIKVGQANHGDTITCENFVRAPSVLVAPYSIPSFIPASSAQTQNLQAYHTNVRQDDVSGEWKFDIVCRLVTQGNITQNAVSSPSHPGIGQDYAPATGSDPTTHGTTQVGIKFKCYWTTTIDGGSTAGNVEFHFYWTVGYLDADDDDSVIFQQNGHAGIWLGNQIFGHTDKENEIDVAAYIYTPTAGNYKPFLSFDNFTNSQPSTWTAGNQKLEIEWWSHTSAAQIATGAVNYIAIDG